MDPRRWGQGLEVSQTTLWENLQEVQNPPWPPPPTHSHPNPRLGALGFSPPLPVVPVGKTLSPRAAARPIGWTPAGIKGHGAEPSGAGILLFFSLCASRTAGHLLKASIWPDLKIWLWIRRKVQIKLPSLCATHYLCINPIFFYYYAWLLQTSMWEKNIIINAGRVFLNFAEKRGNFIVWRAESLSVTLVKAPSGPRDQPRCVQMTLDFLVSKKFCALKNDYFFLESRPGCLASFGG